MDKILDNKTLTEGLKAEALKMAVVCVRNTVIENYHAGIVPQSKTGDYSDVKVVTPYGDIAWNELSRINDIEMKAFNKEVVNLLYTYLQCLLNPHFDVAIKQEFMTYANMFYPADWDEPQINQTAIDIAHRKHQK